MSERVDAAIAHVKTVMLDEENDINDLFEKAVNDLFLIDEPEVLSQAILLLEDHYEYQDLLWSVLHKIEKNNPQDYVKAYLSVLPKFASESPDWSGLIMGSFLNSEPHRRALKTELGRLSSDKKDAVENICKKLTRQYPQQFGASVDYVLGH